MGWNCQHVFQKGCATFAFFLCFGGKVGAKMRMCPSQEEEWWSLFANKGEVGSSCLWVHQHKSCLPMICTMGFGEDKGVHLHVRGPSLDLHHGFWRRQRCTPSCMWAFSVSSSLLLSIHNPCVRERASRVKDCYMQSRDFMRLARFLQFFSDR